METPDRLEKRVVIRAPRARVWRAIADAREFGQWFGVRLSGEFAPGARLRGTFPGPMNEASIQRHQQKLGVAPSRLHPLVPDMAFCTVERIEPERYFSFRWVPFGIDAEADPEREPTTLVEFLLEAVDGGTALTIIESGFDRVPVHRRRRAFLMNDDGWATQAGAIRRHVEAG